MALIICRFEGRKEQKLAEPYAKPKMLSRKSSLRMPGPPGGRTKTISWLLDFCSCFVLKGQQDTRCSAGYIVCPIRSVEYNAQYILRWPESSAEACQKVTLEEYRGRSEPVLCCIYAIYVFIYVLCNICSIWINMWHMQTTYLLCIHKAMNRSARCTSIKIM